MLVHGGGGGEIEAWFRFTIYIYHSCLFECTLSTSGWWNKQAKPTPRDAFSPAMNKKTQEKIIK